MQHLIQNENEIIKHVNVNVKIIASAKKIIYWNPSTCICENSKYFKSVSDTSMTDCDEIIIIMDAIAIKKTNTIATKKTNTIATNVTSAASINYHSKKVKDLLYFTYNFNSDHVTIDNYYYLQLLRKGIIQNGK